MRSLEFFALLTIATALPIINGFGIGRRSLVHAQRRGGGSIVEISNNPPVTPSRRAIGDDAIDITSELLIEISPKTETCLPTGKFSEECRTAEVAAPHVDRSFKDYNITTKPEAAAILSLILFESGNFSFNIHHFPGPNPGQGTSNMMNFPFIAEYALEVGVIKELPDLNATGVDVNATKTDVLNKVLDDEHSFATGAWFYQRKCDNATKVAVRKGDEAGWTQYIEKCVGTAVDEGRRAGWLNAKNKI